MEHRLAEEKWKLVVESAPNALVLVDQQGKIKLVNSETGKMFGFKRKELIGQSVEILVPERYRTSHFEHRKTFSTDPQKREMGVGRDLCAIRKDGSEFPAEIGLNPIPTEDGLMILCSIVDITERKRLEERMLVRDRALMSVISGIVITDARQPDNPVIHCNPAFEKITGYSRDEIIGRNCRFLHNDERNQEGIKEVRKAIEEGEGCTVLLWNYRKDGTPFWNELTISPVKDESGQLTHFVGIINEVTKRKAAEEALQKAREELELRVRERTQEITKINETLQVENTKRKRAEKRLERRNKDLEILNTITQAVHQSLSLENTYRVALDSITSLETVDMAMIYLVDDDREEAILQAQRNVPEEYIRRAGRIPYPKGITWKVIDSGEIYNVKDAQTDPHIGPAGGDLGHHSLLGIPITSGEDVIGVIWFLSYKEREFIREEVELLSSIGKQIAMAIARAKLYLELSKKKRYEEIISAVTRSVHQSLDLQKVIESAVVEISKNIDSAENVGIYLVEGDEAVLRSYSGFHDEFIEQVNRIPYPNGFIWRTIIDGKPIYCPDVDQDTVIGPVGKRAGTKSYVSMPIRFEGKTIGALGISSFMVRNAFNEEELKLLEMVVQQIEIAMNNARKAEMLRESEDRFRKLSESVRVIPWETDPVTHRFTYVGPQVVEILGYPIEDWYTDKFWIEHIHPDDRHWVSNFCEESSRKFDDYEFEYRMITADGRVIWLLDLVNVKRDGDSIRSLRGMIIDITERKEVQEELQAARDDLEKRVTERTLELIQANKTLEREIYVRKRAEDQINKSLKEKEVLLKEIHHRVKNNLQVISSLLSIQSRSVGNRGVQEIFNESNNRVKSMALIHEQLYKADDLGSIDCGEYIKNLVAHIFESYRVDLDNIKYRVKIQEMSVDIDTAMNCGLIIGELVSNSLKHAFPTGRVKNKEIRSDGEVTIELRSDNYGRRGSRRSHYTLIVSNNGKPFPEHLDFQNAKTLGLQLVKTMVEQLDGNIEIKRGEGTSFEITY